MHDHSTHSPHHPNGALKIALFLNGGFAIIEFIGGILTNSTAILSDAIHDLGDAAAIGTAIYFEKISRKQRDKKYTYGYKRYSPLAALINTLILLVGSTVVLFQAVPRLLDPQPLNSSGMILLAILGLIFNGIAVVRLKKETSSVSKKAVLLHLLEDVLGWLAVLLGSIIIKLTGWTIVDPIMSLGITMFILFNVFKNLRSIFKIFMQSAPDGIDENEILRKIKKDPQVVGVHDVHLWTMDGSYHVATIHVVVRYGLSNDEQVSLKQNICKLMDDFDIDHVTIEVEFDTENCQKCD
ncbi:cation diffusion facilitator family transporter [Acetobacteroides hydrogenigenes]|uniref:Cobalt-zinc-cadmium efflux system protein n=1 Tax=Acetobacteroides hydrogenigenes TaxID=979970 RepID=A0A4R2EHX6_9BACT|nr:cation diffusion facilitator family transporter [Acetobacteroides hydrogenigenes]TCN68588.1 cobalt-zinc-cadmium efflux system protein [Acetobacteroides hydrogenigenes]